MKKIIFFLIILILYLIIVTNSKISFVGSWSDTYFSILISIIIIILVIKNWKNVTLLNTILKFTSLSITIPTIIISSLIAYKTYNHRFNFKNINNREFNTYLYNPNVWNGKNGILKISEKSINIPFLELDLGNYLPPDKLRKGIDYELNPPTNKIIQHKILEKFIYETVIQPEIIRRNHLEGLKSNNGIGN